MTGRVPLSVLFFVGGAAFSLQLFQFRKENTEGKKKEFIFKNMVS